MACLSLPRLQYVIFVFKFISLIIPVIHYVIIHIQCTFRSGVRHTLYIFMLHIRTLFGVSQLGPYSLTGVGFIGLGSTYKCGRCMTILTECGYPILLLSSCMYCMCVCELLATSMCNFGFVLCSTSVQN